VQPEREAEVAEVVGRELVFPALGRTVERLCHHAGVVDQEVQRTLPVRGERGDGPAIRQLDRLDEDARVAGPGGDLGGGSAAGL